MDQHTKKEALFLSIQPQMQAIEGVLREVINLSEVPIIKEAATHIIFNGGKRFRPALAILSAKICGYSGDVTTKLGAAIELIHTASIIHDDVLDNAEIRRGVASTNTKWGNHISILIGDYCLSQANKILADHTNQKVISLLADAAAKTAEGETLEAVLTSDLSISIENYLNIIRLKTACLISASCRAGSLIAEAPAKISDSLASYGLNLGIAFQITDDILDYTVESKYLGKHKGTDLKEGKLTLPVICALGRCSQNEREIIKESLLAPHYSANHFESVTTILNKYGCIKSAGEAAEKYLMIATENLSPFRPSLEKEALIKLATFVATRIS